MAAARLQLVVRRYESVASEPLRLFLVGLPKLVSKRAYGSGADPGTPRQSARR